MHICHYVVRCKYDIPRFLNVWQETGNMTLCHVDFLPFCIQGKYGNLDASVVSYGPCQTPTLNFCVERHQKIASFQPEPFWVVKPHVTKGGQSITLEWGRGRLFDMDVAQMFKKVVADGQQLKVRSWCSPQNFLGKQGF